MTLDEAEDKYHKAGLDTRHIVDEPNKVYKSHRHGEVYLYTLSGSARLKLDNEDWQAITSGKEVKIENNQMHEAIVGSDGWDYIFAASTEEMKKQGL